MNVELVPVQAVDQIWPLIADKFVWCLKKTPMEITIGDIWVNCRSGNWFLFIVEHEGNAIAASAWRFTSNGLFECVLMAGERLNEWFVLLISRAQVIAEKNGVRALFATVRPGLGKAIRQTLPAAKKVRESYIMRF